MAQYTENYHLSKPDPTDTQSSFISDYCNNMDKIDQNMGGGGSSVSWQQLQVTGDKIATIRISGIDTDVYSPNSQTFSMAISRANINSDEKYSTIFGKIKKWFADLKAVAFSGSYNDLSNTPTKVSDFTNDSGFVTSTVNNLANYYLKSETYTQAQVDALIGAISTISIEVVQTLPTQDIKTNTIYLVPKQTAGTQNVYDEYIYVNNAWELIGDTEIDLSNYVTTTDLATALQDYVTSTGLSTILANYYTSSQVDTLLGGKVNDVEVNGASVVNGQGVAEVTVPTKTSDLNNDSGYLTDSDVSVTQVVSSGTKIATINVKGTSTDLYAPPSGGGSVNDVTVNGTSVVNAQGVAEVTAVQDNPTFTEAQTRANIASGESFATILGKIKKFFTDLKTVAFSGSYNDLSNKPAIPTDTGDLTNGAGYTKEIALSTTADLDTIKTVGFYSVRGSNTVLNKPTGVDAFGMIVTHDASGEYYSQRLTDAQRTDAWVRYCQAGTWTAWEKIIDSSNIGSQSVSYATSAGSATDSTKLPLTGGTLQGSTDAPLLIKSNNNNSAFICFVGANGTVYGYFGVNSSNKPMFYDSSAKELALKADVVLKTGATMTGSLNITGNGERYVKVIDDDTSCAVYMDSASDGKHGIWSGGYYYNGSYYSSGAWMIYRANNGAVYVNGYASPADNVLSGSSDLNNITTVGFYSVGGGNSVVNKPSGVGHFGMIQTHNASGSHYAQILLDPANKKAYVRYCQGGSSSWTSWETLITTNGGTIENDLTISGNILYLLDSLLMFKDALTGKTYAIHRPTGSLSTNRDVYFPNKSGTIAFTSDISSRRYKENIVPLSDDEAKKILDVEIVNYDYKENVVDEDERYDQKGAIAEDVAELIPNAVTYADIDGEQLPDGINYTKFIPYLIKMVQMQQKEIEELKELIKAKGE